MPIEIEHKFLVTGTEWRQGNGVRISQGYLNRDKERTVRIRVSGAEAFITIKGASKGASRAEFEYPIPLADAAELLKLCDGPIVEKTRYIFPYIGHKWEVDEFLGENAGLVVAEIELESEDQAFERPNWVGQDVTSDPRYLNANLATNPYSQWRNQQNG